MRKIFAIAIIGLLAALSLACGKTEETGTNATAGKATTNTAPAPAPANTSAPEAGKAGHASDENIPSAVKAVFPDAQSFTKQHKDISSSQSAMIERESGSKVPDTDHHSYLAFSSAGGARKQIGAATLVKAGGKDVTIVYESREGKPYIKEVRAEGVSSAFLDQFKGKGHDDKFQVGSDLKAQGADEATAKAIAAAVHVDILTMQALYGGPDTH